MEREGGRVGRKIGSEGAPVLRVKGGAGLEGAQGGGDENLLPFFYSFMKIGSSPVIIPTEWIYDRSALHVVA